MNSTNTFEVTNEAVGDCMSTAKTLPASNPTLITDEAYFFIHITTVLTLGSVLSVTGVVSNTINILVYYKQGVKDSVTFSYLSLSFWDLCLCIMTLLSIILSSIELLFPVPHIDFVAVQYVYIGYSRSVTHIMSTLATVFLSIELCVCIMVPLKVKLIFTRTRSVLTHIAMTVFTVTCNCPAWATQSLQWKFDPRFNQTRLVLWLAKDRPAVEIFLAIFTGDVIQITAQAASIVCAILLISGIKKSAKFRMQTSRLLNTNKDSLMSTESSDLSTISAIVAAKQPSGKKKMTCKSYTKLAKITVVITILFLVFNIPVVIVSLTRTVVPNITGYRNLLNVLYIVVYACNLINCNTSIYVYYNESSKFKNGLRLLLSRSARNKYK